MITSFRRETLELSTDAHLADRARLGSAPAFEELVRRHADQTVAMAMVVTGDACAAVAAGRQAFTELLDQMASHRHSVDDPYLPGLLRCSRKLALADATADPEMRERMDVRLPELARSTRWLTTAVALPDVDVALTLDIEDHDVAGITSWADFLIGDHAEAVDTVLRQVHVLVPATFAADSRAVWRRWLATAGVGGPIGVVGRHRRFAAIEPVAGRILRGAGMLFIVAVAIGAVAGIGQFAQSADGGRPTRTAERAAVERPAAADRRGHAPPVNEPNGGGREPIAQRRRAWGPSGVSTIS